ncbi:QueT transporter family protein [Sphingomonas mucosissima]|uniref:QueT transporter family protein n=1 Tax=Sphingomonas mucosissima TaxID=370959 RepID=UPI000B4AAE60|nr:QueT transporter family protein [Sphingomonas mucosissima]
MRDKSSDQAATVATGIGVVIGGFIGNLIAGFGGMIIGGLALGIIAAITAASGKSHSAKKPPRVRVEPSAAAERTKPRPVPVTVAAGGGSVEDRLGRLDRLKTEGLLSDEEHQAQRKTIIATL